MKILKFLAIGLCALVLGLGAFYGYAKRAVAENLERKISLHTVDAPIPYPLSPAEIEALRAERTPAPAEGTPAEGAPAEGAAGEAAPDPLAGVDLAAIALERARARGKHMVDSRYVCIECHGKNLGGGTMVDDPALGRLLGPNLTSGKGSRTQGYTFADWDRIVRHGVKRDGRPAMMPSEDFVSMSDRELSDIIAYIQSFPPVDNEVPAVELGPLGVVLAATGKLPLSVDMIHRHDAAHAAEAPAEENTPEFGAHLAGVCTGCHGPKLAGGPIAAGPPDWPPAANLTPHASGLAGWTFEQFDQAMRTAKRPDGTALKMPMDMVVSYTKNMKPVEMEALWSYLQKLPAAPSGVH